MTILKELMFLKSICTILKNYRLVASCAIQIVFLILFYFVRLILLLRSSYKKYICIWFNCIENSIFIKAKGFIDNLKIQMKLYCINFIIIK